MWTHHTVQQSDLQDAIYKCGPKQICPLEHKPLSPSILVLPSLQFACPGQGSAVLHTKEHRPMQTPDCAFCAVALQSLYTGVHAHGGPTTVDKDREGAQTLSGLCDRSPADVRGVKMG